MRRAALLAIAIGLTLPAHAGEFPSLPGEPSWQVVRFPAGASSVAVDVVEITSGGGTQIGSDRVATRITIDGAPSDAWTLNLATVPGYPVNCEPRTYVLRWAPDAVSCSSSPSSCIETEAAVGGALCKADPRVKAVYTYAAGVVSGQGLTQAVLTYYARRGERPIRWREIRHASDGDFDNPESTEWEVYFYRAGPTWPELACTVRTTTNPAVTLPAACP